MRSSGVAVSVTTDSSVAAPAPPLPVVNSANSENCESTLRSIRAGFAVSTSHPRSVIAYTARLGRERSPTRYRYCLLYTSDAADDLLCVELGGRRIIKKNKAIPTMIVFKGGEKSSTMIGVS